MSLQRVAKCCEKGSVILPRASSLLSFKVASTEVADNAATEPQVCGRGDKKSKKGKRFNHSFGNPRPKKGWEKQRLREKWEIPTDPAPGSLSRPFPPVLSRY